MDAISSPIVEDLGTVTTPWSGWSAWERAKGFFDAGGLPLSGVWQSFRTRKHTHRWSTTEYSQTCGAVCPAGYAPDNGDCAGPRQVRVVNGIPYYETGLRAPKTHFVETTSGPTVTQESSWGETQWRFTFGHKLDPGIFDAVRNAPRKRSSQAMAELVQGDQLVLGEETRTWDLHLNADELDPSQPVLIGELPLGGHILELSTPDDAETMRLQLHFGVVPPIDLLPAKPLVSCQLSEERNGDDVPFGLRNQSASEHTVRLDAQGPPGWMAMLQGDRIRSLSPGAEDVVMLRIERMNPLATETDPLPFNVTATPLNGTDPPRTATVYVEAS